MSPPLDAALVGLVVLDHPDAADVDETWIASTGWRGVAHALARHRTAGGDLGDIIAAGAALDAAGVDFPRTRAAEAAVAADESVASAVLRAGRARRRRLELRRLAARLEVIALADADVIPTQVERVRAALAEVA